MEEHNSTFMTDSEIQQYLTTPATKEQREAAMVVHSRGSKREERHDELTH